MKRLKDLYLKGLNENTGTDYVSADTIGDITDVDYSKSDDFLKIEYITTFGKQMGLIVKYQDFLKWFAVNAKKHPNTFKKFLTDFISSSSQQVEELEEIIDSDNNIIDDQDISSNSTNTMVGSKSNWDLEKVYKSSIPKTIRFYSGDLGIGSVMWE